MNKKRCLLMVLLILVLTILGCNSTPPDSDKGEEAASSPASQKIRIALVLPGSANDMSWGQPIYEALLEIQKEQGEEAVEIAVSESLGNVADAAAALRDYAANGYNLVIAHGAQYGTSLFELAPDFPKTSFAWGTATNVGTDEGLTNIFAYEPRAEEGGYINGVVAALTSKTDVIGVIGPVEAGDAKLYINGFVAGAKAAKPNITVNVSYTGSFGDTALAAEAANTHIQAGADILTGTAQQVVGAIGVAKEKQIPWLATQADQSSLAPDLVLATELYDWRVILDDMITNYEAGKLGGIVYKMTLENGGLTMVYSDKLPADVIDTAKAAEADIIAGNITITAE